MNIIKLIGKKVKEMKVACYHTVPARKLCEMVVALSTSLVNTPAASP